jgi:hypothetical protein
MHITPYSMGAQRLLLAPLLLLLLFTFQVLEPRGLREGQLHQSLLRVEAAVRAAMPAAPFAMPRPLGAISHGVRGCVSRCSYCVHCASFTASDTVMIGVQMFT